jgi:LuxR family maltose regulon positive regulatory protein
VLVFTSVYRLCLQGLVEFEQLRLGLAQRCFLDAMRQAEEYVGANSVAAALPASLISEVRYEQGRIDEAEAAIIDRIPLIDAAGMLECALRAYVVLARVSAARMNIDRARALLEQAESLGYARQWGRLIAAVLVERLRLFLAEGRITEGGACVGRLGRLVVDYPAPARCASTDIHHYTALARAQLASAENRPQDSIVILRALHKEVEIAQKCYFALGLATQLSVALLGANEPAEASKVFRGVLGGGCTRRHLPDDTGSRSGGRRSAHELSGRCAPHRGISRTPGLCRKASTTPARAAQSRTRVRPDIRGCRIAEPPRAQHSRADRPRPIQQGDRTRPRHCA